ncbi:hypothetical protein ACFL52_00765 [Candidatus Margulisiibacteriota bacterium]
MGKQMNKYFIKYCDWISIIIIVLIILSVLFSNQVLASTQEGSSLADSDFYVIIRHASVAYNLPNWKADRISYVNKGERYKVAEEIDSWTSVEVKPGLNAWINNVSIEKEKLWAQNIPGATKYPSIKSSKNTQLQVVNKDWLWVSENDVKVDSQSAHIIFKRKNILIYKQAGSSKIIGELDKNYKYRKISSQKKDNVTYYLIVRTDKNTENTDKTRKDNPSNILEFLFGGALWPASN